MKKLALLLATVVAFAVTANAAVTSVTWNSVNGGTNATRTYSVNAGSAITNITATTAGAALTASPGGCGITPTLPAGMTWTQTSNTVCTIAGTPTNPSPTKTYFINFRSTGAPTDSLSFITLTVGPITNLNYQKYARLTKGVAINTITPSITGTPTSYSIAGTGVTDAATFNTATGLTFNTTTGAISGTPNTTLALTKFTINATDGTFNTGGGTAGLVDSVKLVIVDTAAYSSWSYYKDITVTPTGIGGNVTNYPLLVRLTSSNFNFTQSLSTIGTLTGSAIPGGGGADIRFTSTDGLVDLPYQIERWDDAGQKAEIWVSVPVVANSGSTTIRMVWGKTGQTTTSSGSNTFLKEDNVQGTWHFNANGTGNELDATANGFTATSAINTGGALPSNNTSSLIGLGRTFPGTSFFKLSSPSTASSVLSFAQSGAYTISSWVNPNTTPTTARVIVGKSNQQYAIGLSGNSPNGLTGQHYEGVEYTLVPNATAAATLSTFWPHAFSPVTYSVWANVVMVQNNGARSVYVNGSLANFNSSQPRGYLFDRQGTTARQLDRDVVFGGEPVTAPSAGTFTKLFTGSMDEISMHTAARDTNWIKLNFQTQCTSGTPAACPGTSPVAYGASVLRSPPTSLAYGTNPASYRQGIPIASNSPTTSGGAPTSYSISPDLNSNTGLTFNTTTGVISGTPTTLSAATDYLVTGTNVYGNDTETVNITVTLPSAPSLTFAGSPYSLTATRTAGTITPSNSGDAATSCSSAPTLPTGLSLSTGCVITGTPTLSSPSTDYTITSGNIGGSTAAHVFITVADTLPAFTSQPAARNAVIGAANVKFGASASFGGSTTVTYKWVRTKSGANGGAIDTVQVTSNTAALTDTLSISSDSVFALADSNSYKVVVTNVVGSVTSNSVLLRITPTVSYSPSTIALGKVSTTIAPTTQSAITTCSSSPTLPAGLSIAATTCIITGTPTTAQAATNYSITPVGPGGTGTAFVLNLAVVNAPRIMHYTADSTARVEQDVAIPSFLPVVLDSFVAPLTYAVTSGSLPDGLSLNANTGAITGTPTSEGSYTPIITATNAGGSVSRTINFTVYAPESYTGSSADFKFNTARAGVNGALSNFPILVRLNNSHRTIFQNTDSSAIRFTNAAGTHLPYQIENWKTDPSDTSAAIWVKLPSVAANDTTIVRMYWGQSVDGGRSEGGLVFPRSMGYQAVWHMNNGGTGNELDASNNGFTATATNAAADTVGAMGRGRKFNGSSNYFTVANSAKGPLDFRVTDSYTMSSWINSNTITATTSTGHAFVNKGDNQYSLAIYGTAATPKYYENTIKANNAWNQVTSTPAGANVGAWRHITGTWTGPAAVGGSGIDSLYVDGQFVATSTITASNTGRSETFNVHIGGLGGGTAPGSSATRFMSGSLDEIRLSNVARSANWIKMEYKNQKPGTTPVANLTYANNAPTYLRTIVISANTPSLLGTATRYEASGLPSGLSINANTGAITGTPSVEGNFNVTVTAYGDSSWSTAKAFSISVAPPGPIFTYSTPQSYLFGQAISTLSPSHTGGAVTTWTIDPALPTGLSFNTSNGNITGTPAAVIPATDFTIIGSSENGADTAVVNITVYSLPPVISYSSPQSYLFGQAISALNPSNSGAASTNWSVSPALPSGLSLNASTGSITGTPSAVSSATDYTVIAVAPGGASDTAVVNISTYSLPPVISYTGSPFTYNYGSAISTLSASNSGAASSDWSISPALPSGLSLNTSTGSITGTPAVVTSATDYTVIAVAPGGASDTAVINIATAAVVPSAPTGLSVAPSFGKIYVDWIASSFNGGSSITGYTVTANPGGATCTWTSGPLTCTVTGLTNSVEYTVSVVATNSVGNSDTSSTALATPGAAPVISYAGAPYIFSMGSTVNQGATNSGTSASNWTISPNLNANTGLLFNPLTGRITGTPVYVSGATAYRVTATNAAGKVDRTTIRIATSAVAPNISYASPQSYGLASAITQLAPSNSGGTVSSWSISPNLTANTGLGFSTLTGKISGTPVYMSSATDYTVIATGFSGTADTAIVNIGTFSTPPNISYTGSPFSFEVPVAISTVTPTNTGSVAVSWSISPNLTANTGLAFSTTMGKISGTPVYSSPATDYTIIATAVGGATDTAVVNINTFAAAPTVSYDSTPQNYLLNVAITPLSKTGTTGIITGYSISPALPSGLTFSSITGRIEGTPKAVTSATNYVITATGPGGTGKDTVNIQTSTPAPTVSYDNTPLNYSLRSAITPLTKTGTTGIITGYSISPALPAGLGFSTVTGAISGTPTALSAAANYVITATGPGGTGKDTVNIQTSTPAPTVSYDNTPLNYSLRSAITPLTKTGTTGIITGYSISPALPAGLGFSTVTGAISGTPTALSAAADYEITASGLGGTGKDTVNIAVTAPVPTVSYDNTPHDYALLAPITTLTKTGTSGIISGYSISPALPAGLVFSTVTGAIGGTPTALSAATDYVITATGPGGTGKDTISIAVTTPVPTVSYDNTPLNYALRSAITTLTKTGATGLISSYSISPVLPAGLVFSTVTGAIGGTPTALSAATDYEITATGPGGSGKDTVNIAVTTPVPTVSYDNAPLEYSLRVAITTLTKTGTTGLISSYSISPALPVGLVFSTVTGAIGGTPTALSAATNYEITATGPGGSGKDTVNIAVTTPVPTVSYNDAPVNFTLNVAATTVTKTSASGIISGYSISPTLPAGLIFSTVTGAIGGTPSALSAAADYVITATGPGGSGKDTINIAVTTPPPTVSYTNTPMSYPVGVLITTLAKSGVTGIVSSYAISPSLPTGLTFSTTTGKIDGNPSVVTAATDYVITVTGPGGTGKDTVNIATTANPPVLSFAASPYSFVKNAAVTAFRADNAGGPITSWSISNGSNGSSLTANTGLTFSTITGKIQGTPVYVSAPRTYVVTANGLAGSSDTETVSIAVTLVAKLGGESAFTFRVTGGAMGYNLRMPKVDANTENVTVTISDLSGRKVWSQSVDPRAGLRELAWDGRDQDGHLVAGGMYMVRISATNEGKTSTVTNKTVTLDH